MGKITIVPLSTKNEAEACANMMAHSEPWITLRRGYTDLLMALQNPAREVYLAKVDTTTVGLIMLNMQGAFSGYIQSICIALQWRSQGIGRQLMAFAEDRIFSETPNAFLCVSSFNTSAQKFYADLGYQAVGELKDYLVEGYTEILLRKSVAPLIGFDAASFLRRECAT